MDKLELIKAFGAFFAIMNPFVNLPIFLSQTEGYTDAQQRSLAIKVSVYAALMCGVILLVGNQIISFFGISVDQFRVAGGAVLAHIAWTMLNGAAAASHHGNGQEQAQLQDLSSIAFYPITFPMIVGPGTIATIIIYAGHSTSLLGLLGLACIIASILLLLYVVLYFSASFSKRMSATMRVITTRLMGMILLAIAVEMVVDGLLALMPGLAGGH